jgi:signal transduction histidine kinase
MSSQTHFDQDGNPARISGLFTDITDRKMAETEARQLAQRLLSVQDEERQVIARELHDSTAQHLVAAGLNMMALKARAASDGKICGLCEQIEGSLEKAHQELRTFTYLLHPPELESEGLRATLHRYIEGFGTRTGLKVRVSSSLQVDDLPPAVQSSLLRVVQEALANVHRHASASRVTVTIKSVADQIHLMVSDDGRGIQGLAKEQISATPRAGLGIPGMAARLRQLGGNLDIHSGASGTTLYGVFPAHAKADQVRQQEHAGKFETASRRQ